MNKRTITLSPDGNHLIVSSEYNEEIILIIKSFGRARWNRAASHWSVPVAYQREVLDQLARFRFEISKDLASNSAAAPTNSGKDGSADNPRGALSISELTGRISASLKREFSESIWVRGEMSSFDRSAGRRHQYFDLIEKVAGQDEIAAKISAVIFYRTRQEIERRLTASSDQLALRDGLMVMMRGRVDYYRPTGRLQLIVDDIDPNFTLGHLALRRQEILERLRMEGLLERNVAIPMPLLPFRVGLITAASSDALHDFLETLKLSPYGFEVTHAPSAVQGARLEPEVLKALEHFSRRRSEFDVIVVIRGGGSRSDLSWFDNEAVARRVATHPIKVIIGIGHERDRSVLDELALGVKTPTAAAELLVQQVSLTEQVLEQHTNSLVQLVRTRLGGEIQRRQTIEKRLQRSTRLAIEHNRNKVEVRHTRALETRLRARLSAVEHQLEGFRSRFTMARLQMNFQLLKRHLDGNQRQLRQLAHNLVRHLSGQLDLVGARVTACDPQLVLARGFVLVRDSRGSLVRTVRGVGEGDDLRLIMSDGQIETKVSSVHSKPEPGSRS